MDSLRIKLAFLLPYYQHLLTPRVNQTKVCTLLDFVIDLSLETMKQCLRSIITAKIERNVYVIRDNFTNNFSYYLDLSIKFISIVSFGTIAFQMSVEEMLEKNFV